MRASGKGVRKGSGRRADSLLRWEDIRLPYPNAKPTTPQEARDRGGGGCSHGASNPTATNCRKIEGNWRISPSDLCCVPDGEKNRSTSPPEIVKSRKGPTPKLLRKNVEEVRKNLKLRKIAENCGPQSPLKEPVWQRLQQQTIQRLGSKDLRQENQHDMCKKNLTKWDYESGRMRHQFGGAVTVGKNAKNRENLRTY